MSFGNGREETAFDFPSSPPLLAFDFSQSLPLREARDDFPNTSSDPPLFSSDDTVEAVGLENYQSPRQKRKRKGAWWGELAEVNAGAKKKKLSRNVDSGVWMASDDSLPSSDSSFVNSLDTPEDMAARKHHSSRASQSYRSVLRHIPQTTTRLAQKLHESTRDAILDKAEDYAREKILQGVANNEDCYDLDKLGLKELHDETIEPLNTVIRRFIDPGESVPGPEYYTTFSPQLSVNISQNALHIMPPALWNIQHITVLVLKQNSLTELPPQISNLKSLKTLNLASNKLRWLPYEMMDLFKQSLQLTLFSNPMLYGIDERLMNGRMYKTPSTSTDASYLYYPWEFDRMNTPAPYQLASPGHSFTETELEDIWHSKLLEHADRERAADWKHECDCPRYISSTPPTYFLADSSIAHGSFCLPTHEYTRTPAIVRIKDTVYDNTASWLKPQSPSAVPSLFEQALRCTVQNLDNESALEAFGHDTPDAVSKGLAAAEKTKQLSGTPTGRCSTCGREYVVPRAQWVEFWYRAWLHFVPLMRRVCSWGCVPVNIAEGSG